MIKFIFLVNSDFFGSGSEQKSVGSATQPATILYMKLQHYKMVKNREKVSLTLATVVAREAVSMHLLVLLQVTEL